MADSQAERSARMFVRLQNRDDGRLWAAEDEPDLRAVLAELRRVDDRDWSAAAKIGELGRFSHGQFVQLSAWLDDQLQAAQAAAATDRRTT
jgi:hypothetical protein